MNTYKFRTECRVDVANLMLTDILITQISYDDGGHGGTATITSRNTLEEVIEFCWSVPNGHVMAQTVQSIEQFTGGRDWDRKRPNR